MNVNLANTVIEHIDFFDDKFVINTINEKRTIFFRDLLTVKYQEIETDDSSGVVGTIIGSLVGLAMGEITAVIGGGFGGWLMSKFFQDKNKCFVIFEQINKELLSFTSEEDNGVSHVQNIEEKYNEFFEVFFDKHETMSKVWKKNLKEVLEKKDNFIAYSDIFYANDSSFQKILSRKLNESNVINNVNKDRLDNYFKSFNLTNNKRKSHNESYIKKNINNKYLKNLIISQKRAVLTDEDSTLINAGAGSGKTTTVLHKISHLLEKKLCKPEEILVLAYNKNVREELTKRIINFSNNKIKNELKIIADKHIHTFHAYGAKQIKNKSGAKIIDKASDFEHELTIKKGQEIDTIINKLFKNKKFKDDLLKYFSEYFFSYKDYFKDIENFSDYVKYIRNIGQITLSGHYMRSYEEVEIANYLHINGINFEYEKEYKGKYKYDEIEDFDEQKANDDDTWYTRTDFVENKNINHLKKREDSNYRPDFYLNDYDIYLEHFALNRNNEAPSFFKEPSQYYSQYLEKLKVHKKNKTKLITTFSWQKSEGILLKNLEKQLNKHKVKFKKLKDDEIIAKFKKAGRLNNFSKLISTFMSHFKSNEYHIDDVKKKIFSIEGDNNKKRSLIFLNLFNKIFMEYEDNLRKENAIDFDDMIIEGRKQIKNDGYKYIIVDEFQDISQARAKLLKELKNTNNAKLYCVGDDWQAINQFNGGDISIFTKDFEKLFGFFERVDIDTTFRFGEKINELSSKFIQKNPSQLNKNMNPFKQKISGNIKIYNKNEFMEVIKKINKISSTKNFILGRYNSDKYDNAIKKRFYKSNIVTKHEIDQVIKSKKITLNIKLYINLKV